VRRAALLVLLALAACGGREVEDTGLSLVARRDGENGYLVWGRTTSPEALELSVEDGDRVLFGKYSGQTVKVDGDELLVMREEDLFAVVEK